MQPEHAPLAQEHGRWLVATVAVTLLPHAQYLPPWTVLLCVLMLVWRVAIDRGLSRHPNRLLLFAIAAGLTGGTLLEYQQLLGKDPGLTLLAGLAGLKLLESRSRRDGRALVFLCFFLQMGQFLNGQEISVAVLTLAGTLISVSCLMVLVTDRRPATVLRQSAVLLAQALPFALLFFMLFPRIDGPLWGLPRDAFSGLTGLSDTMRPGSISQLIRSGAIAFRAEFDGPPPAPRLRYWRGPVLSHFDGTSWRPAITTAATEPSYTPSGAAYTYRLTVEAHNQLWLLALDYPGGPLADARFTSDLQLVSPGPLRARRRIALTSFPDTRVGVDEGPPRIALNLRLPESSNPRLRALGAELGDREADPGRRVALLVDAFRRQDLTYTLNPPLLGSDASDAFFFDTRAGFCEHFASAFAIAARAAGVPARVVTGYQGGEVNPLDGTLVVRQSDAHAWVEVWLGERGWQRVDPTAAANPLRIESGIADALPDPDVLPLFIQPHFAWVRALRYRWEAISNTWNQWVLGYNSERQRYMLRRLGFPEADWRAMIVALTTATGVLTAAYVAWALRRRGHHDPLDRLWNRFCTKLARAGTRRPGWQGPLEFAAVAARRHPRPAAEIDAIARAYARMRYGSRPPAKRELNSLRKMIEGLRL